MDCLRTDHITASPAARQNEKSFVLVALESSNLRTRNTFTRISPFTMRAKRSKKYRKLMHQYELTFGFREPYQVLGTLYPELQYRHMLIRA